MIAASTPTLPYPREASLVDLWQQQVQTRPDRIAVIEGQQRATYADLDRWSGALALQLARVGAGPDTRVAVAIDRSIELLVAWLAVLKTSAAYVPLDTDYPAARVSQMLEDAAVTALVGRPQLGEQLPFLSTPRVTFDLASLDREAGTLQSPSIPPTAAAYVMFTSGSTGRPKGAVVSHRAIVQLVRGQSYVPFGPELVFLVIASPAFDAITFEVWGALLNGGRCAIYRATQVDFAELETLIRTHGVTTSFLATRLFNRIVDLRPSTLAGLRHLVIGGEALSPVHIRRALTALPGVALVNGYGPTECTTFACTYPIPGDGRWPGDSVPIGHPLAHTRARVLDASLQPVAAGDEGELYLGGDGLAGGYFRRPDLTAERFVELREHDGSVRRFYRTGDICQLLSDGALVFRGRRDGQVKLRGFRIELEEIETALRHHPAVQEAAVALQPGFGGSPQLFAYVVPAQSRAFSTDRVLRQWISDRLPAYMAPAYYRITSALPLTANGKLDRARLPQWTATELPPDVPYRNPGSATEQILASIWGEALGIKRLGIDRDFFQSGGDSLLALQVTADMERAFRRKFSPGVLFDAPTVAIMAELIGAPDEHWLQPSLRGHGPGAPLFYIPGVFGFTIMPQTLARRLNGICPYCDSLHFPGSRPGEPIFDSVSAIAAELVKQIRACYPGPRYQLAGYSFGGELAFEVAAQLRASGAEVLNVFLLDSMTNVVERQRGLIPGLIATAGFLLTGPTDERRMFLETRFRAMRERIEHGWRRLATFGQRSARTAPALSTRAVKPTLRARRNHQLRPVDTHGVYLRSREQAFSVYYSYADSPTGGWENIFLRGLEVHEFECNHHAFIVEPMISRIADIIVEKLRHESASAAPTHAEA